MRAGDRPFFSAIMPVRNGERYIAHAVDSLLAQTFGDWELIIVDDASTDRTPEMIREYVRKDPRIRTIRNAESMNCGPASDRGIGIARGTWITRLDSDDAYRPEYLSVLHDGISRCPKKLFFFSSWVSIMDDNGDRHLTVRVPEGNVVRFMIRAENLLFHSATSFPKALYEKAGGYPPAHHPEADDKTLWKKFFSMGVSLEIIKQPLVDYRIHTSSVSFAKAFRGESKEVLSDKFSRKALEWKASLFLKQGMLSEARQELLHLKRNTGHLTAKNWVYYFLSRTPPFFANWIMWWVRPWFLGFVRKKRRP